MNHRLGVALVLLLIVAGLLAVALEPSQVVLGKLSGDAFYASRPTRYWARSLQADPGTQAAANAALQEGAGDSVPVLLGILQDYDGAEHAELRCTAVEILAKAGPDAAAAGPSLLEATHDPDPHVQAVAIAAVPKVGLPAEVAVPVLIELLKSEHNVIAARALSEYRGAAAPAVPSLINLLNDTSQSVEARWNAARTIGKIGPEANPAVPVLIEKTRDAEPTIREHAAEAIGDIGPTVSDEAITALVASMSDSYPRVRRDAVRSLGYIGPKARGVLPEIRRLLEDPEKMVQEAARNAIRAIDPDTGASDPADSDRSQETGEAAKGSR